MFDKAIKLNHRDNKAYLNKGNFNNIYYIGKSLFGLSNFEEAASVLSRFIELDPKCGDGFFYLG